MDKLGALMRKLDYQFKQKDLLQVALTHRSRGANNYERLEFLGDSILGFVIADWLYHAFPDLTEGKLSRMRASLVRKETLAEVAIDFDLSQYLLLGEGEMKSGGFNRASILSDTIESLIGAIYLDSDFNQAKRFIMSKFANHLESISPQTTYKDAKSRLQEMMQKRGVDLPEYEIINSSGEQHEQQFSVQCRLPDMNMSAEATALTRRRAEQKAASLLLTQLAELPETKLKSKASRKPRAVRKKPRTIPKPTTRSE
jgi:ribonuclease-3